MTGIGRYARSVSRVLIEHSGNHEIARLAEDFAFAPATATEEEFELPSLIEREGVDVFHTPLFHLPAVLPSKSIVTIHDAIPAVRPDLTNADFARLFDEACESAERADAVVCPSERAKADLVRTLSLSSEKLWVVPEAPDTPFKPATPTERARVRQEHSLGDDPFLLVVGSLEKRKNPACVLEALATLGAQAPLTVFAGPAAGFDLESAAKRLQVKARALGSVSDRDLVALYSEALALVFPSLYEGFGLPVVEAFACGTPVVATNAASIPEVAGDAALFFDPSDPSALANALREVLASTERRADLVLRGNERLKTFTPERVRDAFLNLYTTLERRAA
jgi:glycosyltransferase involved in cell wall biosynthesis